MKDDDKLVTSSLFAGVMMGLFLYWVVAHTWFYPNMNHRYCAAMQFVAENPATIFWSATETRCYIELTPGVMVNVLSVAWPK